MHKYNYKNATAWTNWRYILTNFWLNMCVFVESYQECIDFDQYSWVVVFFSQKYKDFKPKHYTFVYLYLIDGWHNLVQLLTLCSQIFFSKMESTYENVQSCPSIEKRILGFRLKTSVSMDIIETYIIWWVYITKIIDTNCSPNDNP